MASCLHDMGEAVPPFGNLLVSGSRSGFARRRSFKVFPVLVR